MEIHQPSSGGSGDGVTSLNTLTGDVTLAAGSNISLTPVGNTITIASSGGGANPGGSGTQVQYRFNATTFGGIPSSVVDAANEWLGLGITPTKRLHVKATTTTLAPPTSLNITSAPEVTADNPTVVAAAIPGPDDSTTAAIGAPTQNDGAGSYVADGSTSITYNVYGYITVLGINYYVGTASTTPFTDNSDASNFSVGLSWSAVTGATGYILQASGSANNGNPNFIIDNGNVTTFNDDGAQVSSASIPTLFSTICFYPPATPVANDPNTFSGTSNPSYANYPDDGSITSIGYDIYAYDNAGPIKYYSNNPTSGFITPPGLGGTFGPDLTWASGGSQTGFKIIITVNLSAGGSTVGSYDAGNVTSLSNFVANSADLTVTPPVSSFTTTTTRTYNAYGFNTSPVTTYSPSGYSYSVTDTAPVNGYVIVHTLTYGVSVNAKVLGSYNGQTLTASFSTSAASFLEGITNVFTGDATVTPVHYGTLAAGQTVSFKEYSSATSPFTYYSTLFASGTFTFPNDGVYYVLTLTWVNGGGTGVRFLRDTGSGFNEYTDTTGTSFSYYSYPPAWGSGSTVTPNTLESTAAIFQSGARLITDDAQVVVKSSEVSSPFMKLGFKDSFDATKMSIGNDSSYNMQLFASGANFDFIVPSIGLTSRLGSQFTTLNLPFSSSYYFQVNKGSSGTMFKVLSNASARTRVFVGNDTTDTFSAALTVTPDSTADEGIFVNHRSANGIVFRVANSASGSVTILMNASGKIALNRSIIGSGLLTLGPGDTSNPQIQFDDTSTISTATGGFSRKTSDGGLRYNYVAGTPTRIITDTGTDISSGVLPRMSSGSSSQMVASGISDNGSVINFSGSLSVLFGNGLSVSGNKNLTMGGGATYTGGIKTSFKSISASASLNLANNSPITEFTGSTAGRTLTLPTAASIDGTVFEILNRATVSVTVNTTSSQNINIGGTTVTSIVLQPGDNVKFVATLASTWDAIAYTQTVLPVANGGTGNTALGALTKTDDTNVTLTLGGSPTTALVNAASLTLGWTGTLSIARGGTGASTLLGAGLATVTNVSLTNQSADITTTNLATVAGLYRVSYNLQDTTADITAGIVTLTISYTDGAGATTTTTTQALTGVGRSTGSVYIQLASGNLTYATSHTGIFGSARYALYLSTERLS